MDSKPPSSWDNSVINFEIFQQILELDDGDDSHEFSHSTVDEYLKQVTKTIEDMDQAYLQRDLRALSELGHFLKGSSAALGVEKVKESCEQMQHVGQQRDEITHRDLSETEALNMLKDIIARVKEEHKEAAVYLKSYFET